MKLNADLNEGAVVHSHNSEWIASPLPGVERRMLERDGDEVARVTSIVRYAPGSHFSEHTHTGGEEFYVLEGTFSDQYGDFPAGTYVRNPIGSKHRPHSTNGCTILVKLYWMHEADQEFVRINTLDETHWLPSDADGLDVMLLHRFDNEENNLVRLASGAVMSERAVPGGEEIFVLEGTCEDQNGVYEPGCWIRYPIGSTPPLTSKNGCKLLVKRGHLLNPPPGPK